VCHPETPDVITFPRPFDAGRKKIFLWALFAGKQICSSFFANSLAISLRGQAAAVPSGSGRLRSRA
jgi:hypothetical protein